MSSGRQEVVAFKTQVRRSANELDVSLRSLTVRPMKNKWASCSSAGNFTFNADLLDLDQDLQNYVIVHELIHARVPNHGKLWKSLMSLYVGDYKQLESRLRSRCAET